MSTNTPQTITVTESKMATDEATDDNRPVQSHLFLFLVVAFLSIALAAVTLSEMIHDDRRALNELRSTQQTQAEQITQLLLQIDSLRTAQAAGVSVFSSPVYTQSQADTLYAQDVFNLLPQQEVALVADGAMYVREGLTVSGEAKVYTARFGYITVSDLVDAIDGLNSVGANSEVVCPHGFVAQDGSCVCIGSAWTGSICNINTCSGRGTWLPEANTCECAPGYDPYYDCATRICLNGGTTTNKGCVCPAGYSGEICEIDAMDCADSCMGTCVRGECVCSEFGSGEDCENDCSPTGVRNGQCFLTLDDTCYDKCATQDGVTVCYCGGGFEYDTDELTVKTAMCVGCSPTEIDMALCCSPGVLCENQDMCHTIECCTTHVTRAGCLSSGCAWCASANLCSAVAISTCNATVETGTKVKWKAETIPCDPNGRFQDECGLDVRMAYLDVYTHFLQVDRSSEPRARARDYINSMGCQMRQFDEATDYGKTFYMQISSLTLVHSVCGNSVPAGYLGVTRTFAMSNTDMLGVVCKQESALKFWQASRSPCNSQTGEGTVLMFEGTRGDYCLSDVITTQNILQSNTGWDPAVHAEVAIGKSLVTPSFGLTTEALLCADIRYDQNQSSFVTSRRDGVLYIDTVENQLRWTNTEPALAVTIIRHLP